MPHLNRRSFMQKTGMGLSGIALAGLAGKTWAAEKAAGFKPLGGKVIDAHLHFLPESLQKCLAVMDDNSIRYGISMGSTEPLFYKMLEAAKPHKKRLGVMYRFDWTQAETDPEFFKKAPDMLEKAIKAGGLGVKMWKDLGLTAKDKSGALLKIDDPRLFPIFERAEKLGCIVAWHATDPKAFFEWPIVPQNERYEELHLHPEWSFGDRTKFPDRLVLLEQVNNVIRKFKNLKFQCVHGCNNAEDIKTVAKWMAEMPNMYADVSARLGELGRHPAAEGHGLFTTLQDRWLFGTDMYFDKDCQVQGAGPCADFPLEKHRWFYQTHWRYFQTMDKQFDHPTPVQGNWKIDGVGLEPAVLQKLYWDNAYKLYKLDRFGVA